MMTIDKILSDKEFMKIAHLIIDNEEFQKRKTFLHHNDSVYEHSIKVAYRAYKFAKTISKIHNVSIEEVIVASLLHDFYTTPWQDAPKIKKPFYEKHGFIHGKIACQNAKKFFPNYMTLRVEDSITKHMFPLTKPPKYLEGWLITLADKYVSLDVFLNPLSLPKYIGIRGKNRSRWYNEIS